MTHFDRFFIGEVRGSFFMMQYEKPDFCFNSTLIYLNLAKLRLNSVLNQWFRKIPKKPKTLPPPFTRQRWIHAAPTGFFWLALYWPCLSTAYFFYENLKLLHNLFGISLYFLEFPNTIYLLVPTLFYMKTIL